MFIGVFSFGLTVASNFAAAASTKTRILHRFQTPVRYLSSFTFSVYLLHMRLIIPIWHGVGVRGLIGFCFLLALPIFPFGEPTERQTKLYGALLPQWTPSHGNGLVEWEVEKPTGVSLPLRGINENANPGKT
jgi:hypothetical protein